MNIDLKNADVRNTTDIDEISNLFELAKQNDATVNIWYFIDGKRKVHFGKLVEIEEGKTLIQIELEDDNPVQITREIEVFFRIDFQNMIFKKSHIVVDKKGQVNFQTPTSLRLIERRKRPRFIYLYNDHKEFVFGPDVKDIDQKEQVYFSKLINISEEGAGIVMTETSFNKFFGDIDLSKADSESIAGKKIKIKSITDQKLPENFFAKTVYFVFYDDESEGDREVRIGVKFDETIPHLEYHSINETNRQKLEREKRQSQEIKAILSELNIQGYHGMTVGEQEALYKKLTKEEDKHVEELRTNIESLEQLEYLTKSMKIKLFQEMKVSSLAIALRLCRKFVIISLIKDISEI